MRTSAYCPPVVFFVFCLFFCFNVTRTPTSSLVGLVFPDEHLEAPIAHPCENACVLVLFSLGNFVYAGNVIPLTSYFTSLGKSGTECPPNQKSFVSAGEFIGPVEYDERNRNRNEMKTIFVYSCGTCFASKPSGHDCRKLFMRNLRPTIPFFSAPVKAAYSALMLSGATPIAVRNLPQLAFFSFAVSTLAASGAVSALAGASP